MTIHRLSYSNGIIFDVNKAQEQLDLFLARDSDSVKVLSSGEYNLTPKIWRGPAYDYNLIVNDDGTGVMRQIPRDKSVGSIKASTDTLIYKEGGRLTRIPHDAGFVVVAGPKFDDPRIRLFEAILYTPGRKESI